MTLTIELPTPASTSALQRTRSAWGGDPPDWVEMLARACDETSQAKVAARLKCSTATVSQVLNAKYGAGLGAVEQRVRGVFMAEMVACPLVGELAADTCLEHQRAPWSPHNPQRIAFYRACRSNCPHSRLDGGKYAE